jgi:hypothetical protein
MRPYLLIAVVVILLILFVRAYAKETIEPDLPDVSFNLIKPTPKPRKRKKVRSSKEEECRAIFEELLGASFPTKRPSFLRNPDTGRNLELDGYNADLKVAFEYNGAQHYDFPNTFHRTREDFDRQVARDRFKENKCKELDIELVSIPYTVETKDLPKYIMRRLKKLHLIYRT